MNPDWTFRTAYVYLQTNMCEARVGRNAVFKSATARSLPPIELKRLLFSPHATIHTCGLLRDLRIHAERELFAGARDLKLNNEPSAFVSNAIGSGEAHASFSQLGEDCVLWWLFHAKKDGFYVDIGCHHPYRFSNTAVLHLCNNWRGINVDPDPRAISAFQAHRPEDRNICCGVSIEDGQREITIFEEGALNSFDANVAANPAFEHIRRDSRVVPVRTLSSILDEHLSPGLEIDLLNVDVEGLDFSVIQSNNWDKYLPAVIVIESHNFDLHNPESNETFQFLVSRGYRLISYVGVTCIFDSRSRQA